MEIGPFTLKDVEVLTQLFESKGVAFEFFIDEEVKALFIELSDSDYEKVKVPLENFGVVPTTDGSFELGEMELAEESND